MLDYQKELAKIYLTEQIFMDVFTRFYHQLSFQDGFVLKDFYKDKIDLSASIIDAILEAVLQRIPLTQTEEKKLLDDVYKSWESTEAYNKLDPATETDVEKVDSIHDPKIVCNIIKMLTDTVVYKLTDKQLEKADKTKLQPQLGDYNPVFLLQAKPPFDVWTEKVPSM